MNITVDRVEISIEADELVSLMSEDEIALFLNVVSNRIEGSSRSMFIKSFSEGMGENGLRFLARVVALKYSSITEPEEPEERR